MSENNNQPPTNPNPIIGTIITCVLFAVPLAIAYNSFIYNRKGWMPGLFLLASIYAFGYIATLLFYRMVIKNDAKGQINKINSQTARWILGNVSFAFMIVVITLIAISIYPDFVKIFENTLGYWFIGIFGREEVARSIFTSPTFEAINETNPTAIHYGFLLTLLNPANIESFIESIQNPNTAPPFGEKLPLDFKIRGLNDADKLRQLIAMKYTFGHYTWIYLASVVSLIVSFISVTL